MVEEQTDIKEIQLRRGEVMILTFAHDDWCGIFQGEDCNCDPDISGEVLE